MTMTMTWEDRRTALEEILDATIDRLRSPSTGAGTREPSSLAVKNMATTTYALIEAIHTLTFVAEHRAGRDKWRQLRSELERKVEAFDSENTPLVIHHNEFVGRSAQYVVETVQDRINPRLAALKEIRDLAEALTEVDI